MQRKILVACVWFGCLAPADADPPPFVDSPDARLVTPDELQWTPTPQAELAGATLAVLEGSPTADGPWVVRVKLAAGFRLARFAPRVPLRMTVLSGTLRLARDDVAEAFSTALPAGSYLQWPKDTSVTLSVEAETIVQVQGFGPWPRNPTPSAPMPADNRVRRNIEFTGDSLDTVRQNIAAGNAVLVDVRSEEEWRQGQIAGSIFLPITSLRGRNFNAEHVEQVLHAKQPPKVLYTFCVVGMRAKQAALVLERHGYVVRPLQPGFEELLAAGFAAAPAADDASSVAPVSPPPQP